ncbi:MAG: hypothetical protein JNN27_08645 [Planctomycetes bacterium]|nr:hypothetical protein [Planctomycetota bacterium]
MRVVATLLALLALSVALLFWLRMDRRVPEAAPATPARASEAVVAPAAPPSETPAATPLLTPPEERAERDTERPLAALLGRLMLQDGSPAAGLSVRLFEHTGGSAPHDALSASDGSFEFLVEAGRWQLGAEAPTGCVAWLTEVDLAPDSAPYLEHRFAPGAPLCVRVWTNVDGVVQPALGARLACVEGASSSVEQRAWSSAAPLAWSAVDAEGRATTPALPASEQLLFVEAPGAFPLSVLLDPRSAGLDALRQSDGCVHVFVERVGLLLRGRVRDESGAPLAGAVVGVSAPFAEQRTLAPDFGALGPEAEALGRTIFVARPGAELVRTDAQGRFEVRAPELEFAPRAALALVVWPARADYPHHQSFELDLVGLDAARELDLRLQAGFEYELEIVDPQGAPHAGPVRVRDVDGRPHAPPGARADAQFEDVSTAPLFPLVEGRLKLRHLGGVVLVGAAGADASADDDPLVSLPLAGPTGPVPIALP